MSECVTHHFACDCREKLFEEAIQTHRRVVELRQPSDQALRLLCGELSAQELRAIRAILNVCANQRDDEVLALMRLRKALRSKASDIPEIASLKKELRAAISSRKTQ